MVHDKPLCNLKNLFESIIIQDLHCFVLCILIKNCLASHLGTSPPELLAKIKKETLTFPFQIPVLKLLIWLLPPSVRPLLIQILSL